MTTELRPGPLYFFDQPTRRNRVSRTRGGPLQVNGAEGGAGHSDQERDDKERETLTGETCDPGTPDAPSCARGAAAANTKDHHDAYRRAAPRLLHELALVLWQQSREEGLIPRGVVNILNYTWQDLTAGVKRHCQAQVGPGSGCGHVVGGTARQASADGRKEPAGESCEKHPQLSSEARVKRRKDKCSRAAHGSSSVCISISSSSCTHPGWIIRPSCDEPQQITVCQWVVKRLQEARDPEKLQTAGRKQKTPLILCHYGETKAKVRSRGARRKSQPAMLVDGIPQIPEVKQQDPTQQKLHYRTDDGTSFIYYPSGCVAVCQSHSGLPCGGFYTNVFGDSEQPVVMATITASGRGAVRHPLSSSIEAVWDQDGGFTCDHDGNKRKAWTWQTNALTEKIVIQLSDLISVSLLSGTSAVLSFRCNNERVQLPLPALSSMNQSKEPSAQWRRGCPVSRDLRMLRQRVRNTLDAWLDYYRAAIGIKCPEVKQMPGALLGTRRSREVQSAAPALLHPPEWADVKPVRPDESRNRVRPLQRQGSAQTMGAADSSVKLRRASKAPGKEGSCVTQIGALQIHGNIKLESVIVPKSPVSQSHCPVPLSPPPSIPISACPVLLRAALQGEGAPRRCCCSATLMPAVTDLEYDAFVMGQPPHSQQILVVCVTLPRTPIHGTQAVPGGDALERLYRSRNKHRTVPCTQCQMDSFRLVRYETSAGTPPGCGSENMLLQQRHNAAPGMVLMYIRGRLLYVGNSCSVRNLQKHISRTRRDYRLGLSLPPHYKFSDAVNKPVATDAPSSPDATLIGGNDGTLPASVEKERKKR